MKYEAPKGKRIKGYGFCSVTNFDGYWYVDRLKRWMTYSEIRESPLCDSLNYGTDCVGIHSVKAFKRRVKKWSKQLPKRTRFVLVPRYVGHRVEMWTR
jgi:hypothetical protein